MTVTPEPMSAEAVMRLEAEVIAKTFNRQPVVWERGEGHRLWDKQGKAYLDFFAGHAVMNLGYGHPQQLAAMQAQLQRLVHTGNLYYLEPQVRLAQQLVQHTFGDKVFFANSGAEIVDLAIKLARKWARKHHPGEDRFGLITLKSSFHGRTYAALSATGQSKYHAGLEPMLPGFHFVALNDLADLERAIQPTTAAVMLEPVQGEGGIFPAEREYLQGLQAACRKHGLLLIFDEVQCGLGRTGRFNAYEHFGVEPDILLLGKPLGGGLPISALVTRDEIATALQIGDHGSTFGGNPVAAAGGEVLLAALANPKFLEQVRATGAHLEVRLKELAAAFPQKIKAVRGVGLMWGLEVKEHGPEMVKLALELGLVINCTAGKVLRFLPALTIGRAEVDEAAAILRSVLQSV